MIELYLLDRNIIDLMNRHNKSHDIPDAKRISMLNKLKELDVKGNKFSPLLSLIEGKTYKEQDSNGNLRIIKTPNKKIRELILIESDIVKLFIKDAGSDYDYLTQKANELSKILYESEADRLINEKIAFLNKLQGSIGEIRRTEQRDKAYNEFKDIVSRFKEFKEQPMTVVALMYIFGSQRAAKILKFQDKNFLAYNPIADFNHYKTICQLKFDDNANGKINVHFLSLDSDIEFIQELIHPNMSKVSTLTNYTNLLATEWNINKELVKNEIPETKGEINNQALFYSCFKDFYGYDIQIPLPSGGKG